MLPCLLIERPVLLDQRDQGYPTGGGPFDFAGTIPLVRAAGLLFSLASMGIKDNA